jgi:hypothetical protein
MLGRSSSRRSARGAAAVLGAAALGLLTASVALAYPSPGSTVTQVSSSCGGTMVAGTTCTVEFNFQWTTGGASSTTGPYTDHQVFYSTTCVGGTVSPASDYTDSSGNTSVTLTISQSAPSQTCTLTVSDRDTEEAGGPESDPITLTITAVPGLPPTGGLPPTSTGAPGPAPWLYVAFGLGALLVIGGAVGLRRTRRSTV